MVSKHPQFYKTLPQSEVENPVKATLEAAVADALASAGGVDASDVAVIAHGSEIILWGNVVSQAEVSRAEEVARSVSGVTAVQNEVHFQGQRIG